METKKVRSSMTLVLIMVMSLFATLEFSDRAEGSEIVVTDAIQIVASGTHNDRMVAMDADSMGNTHFVWSRNTQHLYYKMLDPRGEVLIDERDEFLAGSIPVSYTHLTLPTKRIV